MFGRQWSRKSPLKYDFPVARASSYKNVTFPKSASLPESGIFIEFFILRFIDFSKNDQKLENQGRLTNYRKLPYPIESNRIVDAHIPNDDRFLDCFHRLVYNAEIQEPFLWINSWHIRNIDIERENKLKRRLLFAFLRCATAENRIRAIYLKNFSFTLCNHSSRYILWDYGSSYGV